MIVEVGHSDTDHTSVLHVPDLGLVVAGDVIYNGARQYVGEAVGGLDDHARRTIAHTLRYLDDADELLRTEATAIDYFDAMIKRYPDHLGRTVLWSGARALYGVRDDPDGDLRQIRLAAWL